MKKFERMVTSRSENGADEEEHEGHDQEEEKAKLNE